MSTATAQQIDEIKTTPWSGGRSPFDVEYGKMMMWFFLLSDAFTFSSLLISYGALRFSSNAWPAPDLVFQSVPGLIEHGAPLVFVGLMTFILIMSSVTMVLAVEAGHRPDRVLDRNVGIDPVPAVVAFVGRLLGPDLARLAQEVLFGGWLLSRRRLAHCPYLSRSGTLGPAAVVMHA